MRNYPESEYKPNLLEKGLWWAKIGGIVAALIGTINQTELLIKGVVLAGMSHIGLTEIYKHHNKTVK